MIDLNLVADSVIIFMLCILILWFLQRGTTPVSDRVLGEIRRVREVLEKQYKIDFGEDFGHSDGFAFLMAIGNAMHRFERDVQSKSTDVNVDYEARGIIAALKLFISWARANNETGLQRKAEETLTKAEELHRTLR